METGATTTIGPATASRRWQPVGHIEVGRDWRRCGAQEGGCGVLLPLNQQTCPRCGRTNREDLLPLNIRRLLPTHDAYDHAVAVLRGTWAGPQPNLPGRPELTGAPAAVTSGDAPAATRDPDGQDF
ncbi:MULTISPECIES: hypothetical protein [Frankia]|uniref:hypothetical protein n=1 Tax=Frankia TaxID=1854 RepID=UPI0005A4F414|nr:MULTISPECIES: hypothetical protein [Frankia]